MAKRGSNLKRYVKLIAGVIAVVFLVLATKGALGQVKGTISPNWPLMAVAVVLFFGSYGVQAFGWHRILRELKQPVTLGQSVRLFYASMMGRWLPGPALVAARLLLATDFGLTVPVVGFAAVLELSYILSSAFLVSILFSGSLLAKSLSLSGPITAVVAITAGLVLVLLLAFRPNICRDLLLHRKTRALVKKVAGTDLNPDDLPSISSRASMGLLLYFAFYWIYSGLTFACIAAAMFRIGPAQVSACVPAFAGSWAVGFLSVLSPAGLGVREAAMMLMLSPVMSAPQALVLSVWSRIIMHLVEAVSVIVAFLIGKYAASRLQPLPKRDGSAGRLAPELSLDHRAAEAD